MSGYSGTPLVKKLGVKPGYRIFTIHAPKEYTRWLGALPAAETGAEFIHLFVTSIVELDKQLPRARATMTPGGSLWVSWYKKSAKVPTDVTEDEIRRRALKTDLVDVKVCAVTDLWSGLKLVVRKGLR